MDIFGVSRVDGILCLLFSFVPSVQHGISAIGQNVSWLHGTKLRDPPCHDEELLELFPPQMIQSDD